MKGQKKKQAYEPPKATCVKVQVKAQYGGCTFTTPSLCGFTT